MAQLRLPSNPGKGPRPGWGPTGPGSVQTPGSGSDSETGHVQHPTAEPGALGIRLWWLLRVRLESGLVLPA